MASLLDLFAGLTGSDTLTQLGAQLGADEAQTGQGLGQALPALLEGLAQKTSSPEGAAALQAALAKDHDGSILDDLGGLLSGAHPQAGKGGQILGHIFGGGIGGIVGKLAQATGMNEAQAQALLEKAAPLVLGYLGKQQQTQGLDSKGLQDMLGQQVQQAKGQDAGLMGMVTGWLDKDGDGSALDDLAGMAGGLLGGKG